MNPKSEIKNPRRGQCYKLLAIQAAALFLGMAAGHSPAQIYSLVHDFDGSNGRCPRAGLALGVDGTLYGTTAGDIGYVGGTVFKVSTNGSGFTVLEQFTGSGPLGPQSRLALNGSTLYGTTWGIAGGGRSVVFKLNVDGSGFTNLTQIASPDHASGDLAISDSTLFGTTSGDNSYMYGTVFSIITNGSGYTVLKNFAGSDGEFPQGGVILSGNTLFGTTLDGGSSDNGTVFKLSTDSTGFTVLKSFTNSDGANPEASPALSGAELYGTTYYGGATNCGTIFKVNTGGSGFAVLKSFAGADGAYPTAGLVCAGTALFGTTGSGGTNNHGTIFRINTDGSGFAVLKNFTGSDGDAPNGLLLSGSTLYGTTRYGGSTNFGVVFSLLLTNVLNIITPPQSQTVVLGSNADIAVEVYAWPPPCYQWYFNNTNAIQGATNSVLQLTNVQFAQAGSYTVVITNVNGAATNCTGTLVVTSEPIITTSPVSRTIALGSTVDLLVSATGTPPLAYQWFFDATNAITGATNSVLHLVNVQFSQAGAYTVVVTNPVGVVTSSPAMLDVEPAIVVTNCTETDLRAAMTTGGKITFATDGTITLSDTIPVPWSTVLDASGHQITVSGGNAVRVFYVATNVSFSIINLTIANGFSTNGAGIFNDGGLLTLSNVLFQGNVAHNPNGPASEGGGVFNRAGTINATNCIFSGNQATAPDSSFSVIQSHGGAIRNESGVVNLDENIFAGNVARGSSSRGLPAYVAADGDGGAIHNSGTINAHSCTFIQNSSAGGDGAEGSILFPPGTVGGAGNGAAIFNSAFAIIESGTFISNSAIGGVGGDDRNNGAGGTGGAGGSAAGGAICNYYNSSLLIQDSAFLNNNAFGGNGGSGGYGGTGGTVPNGGNGGSGYGGAICNQGSLLVQCSAIVSNTCVGAGGGNGGPGGATTYPDGQVGTAGGLGGNGGSGNGGGLCNFGPVNFLINCTFAFNGGTGSNGGQGGNGGNSSQRGAAGGNGGNGGDGGSGNGGVWGSANMTNCTVALDFGKKGIGGLGGQGGQGGPGNISPPLPPGSPGNPGANGANGLAAGNLFASQTALINTLLAGNTPTNCSGVITDLGHNLSSDNSCAFTNIGSMNNTDPKLAPLANNGGPTLTMALFAASPAIDAGENAAAAPTDQRDFPRVVGPRIDIGAYELCYLPVLRINPPQTGAANILVYGLPNQTCRLLASTTLTNWQSIATNQISATGTNVFQVVSDPGQTCRFYRVVTP